MVLESVSVLQTFLWYRFNALIVIYMSLTSSY